MYDYEMSRGLCVWVFIVNYDFFQSGWLNITVELYHFLLFVEKCFWTSE